MSRPPAKAKRRPPDFFQRLARFPSYYGWRASEADENRDFRPPGPPPLPLEADALRRAVLAAPGDDGPRLRFAEWLDRCGDPRGEFIRVQIELARLQPHFGEKATGAFGPNPPAPFPEREGGVFLPSPLGGEGKGVRGISPNPPTPFSEREGGAGRSPGAAEGKDFSPLPFQGRGAGGVRFLPLLDRQRELLLRHAADWLAELAPWGVADAVFRRGFAEAVSVTGRTFISLGDGLLGTAPIREVRLVAVAHLADELGRTANLARLDALDLGGNHLGPDGFAPLARSPHLAGLRALNLARNALGPDGIDLLARAGWDGLRSLDLGENALDAAPLARLLAAGALGHLQRLALGGNRLGADGVATLLGVCPGGLTDLDLSFNDLGPAGGAALSRLASLPRLQRLDLGFNDLGDEGVTSLAGSPAIGRLRHLGLAGNRLTDAGLAALARPGALRELRSLDLGANHLTDAAAQALRRAEFLPGLGRLSLAGNLLTDAGVEALLPGLEDAALFALRLGWNRLGDRAAAALAACPALGALRVLDLTGCRLGWRGAKALADSPHLAKLHALVLRDAPRLHPDALGLLRDRFGPALDAGARE